MSRSGCKLNDWCGYHSFLSTKVYQIKIATSYGVNHWYYKPIEIYLAQKMREEKISFSSLAYILGTLSRYHSSLYFSKIVLAVSVALPASNSANLTDKPI